MSTTPHPGRTAGATNDPGTPAVRYEAPAMLRANGIDLACDSFGEPDAPPLLLIMGLGCQMIAWDERFCARLAACGYRVLRFDNRDIGHSTRLEHLGVPDVAAIIGALWQGQPARAPYLLRDMAADAIGLLDALGIASAHVVGASMGGAIAQEMAIHWPQRLSSLTSIMSNTGEAGLPARGCTSSRAWGTRCPWPTGRTSSRPSHGTRSRQDGREPC